MCHIEFKWIKDVKFVLGCGYVKYGIWNFHVYCRTHWTSTSGPSIPQSYRTPQGHCHSAIKVRSEWNRETTMSLHIWHNIDLQISRLAAADAQSAAISKALIHSKVSNSLVAKLYIGVATQYETANGLLSSLPSSEIASDLKRYLSDGTAFYKVIVKVSERLETCNLGLTRALLNF